MGRPTPGWQRFHQGENLTYLKLAISKFGFGLQLVSDVSKYCKRSIRQILSKSMNNEIKSLFNLTKFNYVQTNTIITSNNDNPKAILTRQIENNVVEHLSTLKEQNTIMKHIKQVFIPKLITMYHNICSQMPKNIFIFVRQVLIFSLPNN